MDRIRIHDKYFEPYITAGEIQEAVRRIAREIERDYADSRPLFIAILNGSFIFAADLFKALRIPAEVCFIKLASYKGTKSTGHVITSIGLDDDVYQRDVIILEDIIDTGLTLSYLISNLLTREPASCKIMTMFRKPEALANQVEVDYVGFDIPNEFVVGYGLDYDGRYRNLTSVGTLAPHVYS